MSERLPGIRPRPSLARRLDQSARQSLPAASTVLLLLCGAAPLGFTGQAEFQAAVALSCTFFWTLFRPAAMPPAVVFVLGLLSDLLSYAPLGVGVLTLLVVHGLAMRWRGLVRYGFLAVWLVFSAIACGAALVQWVLTSLLLLRLLPPGPGLFQALLTVGLYPALAVVMTRVHQSLAEPV